MCRVDRDAFSDNARLCGAQSLPAGDCFGRLRIRVNDTSFTESGPDDRKDEQGVFGRGFDNGLVAIARRLMVTGLLSVNDPEIEDA
ncbi:hypothetical protein [Haloarcula brevis]|uniref:hypothetical protein n=1 Tax=Haloarcula brevis TaxID=3111453 RepID=UPI00300F4134